MSSAFQSLFDDLEVEDFKLWSNNLNDVNHPLIKSAFSGSLLKFSFNQKTWKLRHFVLGNNQLLYFNVVPPLTQTPQDKVPKGSLNLEWCRVYFVTNNSDEKFRFGIRFVRNRKFTDLWAVNEVEFNKWKEQLSKLSVQTNFHEKYSATKMIGKGSFARVTVSEQVYLVEEKDTGARFAVKAFTKDTLLAQKKGRESLMNEIQMMRLLKHENIMRLEEVHETENSVYLILELMEGGELLSFVTQKTMLKMADIAKITTDLMRALEHADSQGIMHRDLKPENIILKYSHSRRAFISFTRR
jgi:tRNA A-37 threonylcarbamoyl transferase component Bud32